MPCLSHQDLSSASDPPADRSAQPFPRPERRRWGTHLALQPGMTDPWSAERAALLGRRISDIGLAIEGTRVERLVGELYRELEVKGIRFRPPVYLSDQWGCPDETPLIGVPFYLADERLERIEAEMAGGVED